MGASPRLGQQVQVTGFIDRVTMPAPAPEFMTLRALSQLTGVGVKVLRSYLMLPTNEALPCYRLPGGKTIVVRRSDFEVWIERFRTVGRPNVDRILKSLGLRQILSGKSGVRTESPSSCPGACADIERMASKRPSRSRRQRQFPPRKVSPALAMRNYASLLTLLQKHRPDLYAKVESLTAYDALTVLLAEPDQANDRCVSNVLS